MAKRKQMKRFEVEVSQVFIVEAPNAALAESGAGFAMMELWDPIIRARSTRSTDEADLHVPPDATDGDEWEAGDYDPDSFDPFG